jgi:hypothetical protein
MEAPSAFVTAIALAFLVAPAGAAERVTERTVRLSAGENSPPATIADMKWLTGRWVGEALGGKAEEIWSEPAGGKMLGMYRLVRGDKTLFYEILTVSEDNGSLVLRLKHFNADLTGWEEKNEVRSFPLVAKKDGAFMFEGMSFHPEGDKLTVYLAIDHKDKPVEEAVFAYQRVPLKPL